MSGGGCGNDDVRVMKMGERAASLRAALCFLAANSTKSNRRFRATPPKQSCIAMVSADNLNLDVLELIFAYISAPDLTSVSLVSRSFLAGAVPTLYRTIVYRLREAKAYGSVCLSI